MPSFNDMTNLDALADALVDRLGARLGFGPVGEPTPQVPSPWEPEPRVDPRDNLRLGARIGIAGIEYTQSIQHNGSVGPSYGADNAVPLVAYKTMVARVYPMVRRGPLSVDHLSGQRVTGELTLSVFNRVLYTTGPSRAEGARVGSASRIDRSAWDRELTFPGGGPGLAVAHPIVSNCALNFVVPAYFCKTGSVQIMVRVWPVADGPTSGVRAEESAQLQFLNVRAPKVCLVRVNWSDGAGNVSRPTDAAMLDTLAIASRMLPFPYFETTILTPEVDSSAPYAALPVDTGGCNPSWTSLVSNLNWTRVFTALFGLGDIVFGLVPQAAIPASATTYNAGCGIGAAGGFVGLGITCAHEIGHLYGRPHVAVDGDVSSDPNYPNYGGSRRSIGEVGIDTGTSPPTLFDPSQSDDLMSYGDNQWISPYTYRAILDARALHDAAPIDPRRLRTLLVIEFRVYRATRGVRRVEVRRTTRVTAPGAAPARGLGAVSPLSLDLVDANARVLATHHCHWAPAHGGGHCGCSACGGEARPEREPWLDFTEAIEWPDDSVAGIDFHTGGDPFHSLAVGEPPGVTIDGPRIDGTQIVVYVEATHSRETPSVVLLFSGDDGDSWHPVSLDTPRGDVRVDLDRVQGGARCVFRAIATAELRSVSADTEPIALTRTARRLHLRVPSGPCPVAEGGVALSAAIDTRSLGAVPPGEIRWSSQLVGDLGAGYVIAPELPTGRHEIRVSAPDGLGGTLEERAIIIVGGRPVR